MNDDQEERGEGEEKEKTMNKECALSSSFAKLVFLFFTRLFFSFFLWPRFCPAVASTIFEFPA